MHTQRFRKFNIELCRDAVLKCFERKWRRNDILIFIEEYAGIDRKLIIEETLVNESWDYRNEVADSLALMLCGVIEDLTQYGIEPDDIEPVRIRTRPDGMTGKERDIALLCILHQLLGHAEKLAIEPLIKARLLPSQHASLPGRGQTKLKNQVHRYLIKESLEIRYARKTDVVHAYATLQYSVIEEILIKEIPKAYGAIKLLHYLGTIAPGGHLIIGGYLDAWLFNFAMSYAMRDLYSLTTKRRGIIRKKVIRVISYMDDFLILTASIKNMKAALNRLKEFCNSFLHADIRTTTGIMKLLPIDEERARKNKEKPSQRRAPAIDMAGYRITRTHITIRRRVFRKARRQFLRAQEEYLKTGTMTRQRAQRLASYYGYFKQSDSRKAQKKYNISELMRIAKKVNRHYSHIDNRKRKERINDLQRYRIEHQAVKSIDRALAA